MLSSYVEWPADPDTLGSDESPFAPRPSLRRLRVVIDDDLYRVAENLDVVTPAEVLTGLLLHDHVICFRYADGGPPPGTRAYELTDGGRAYEGWVTVDPPDDRPDSRGLVFCRDKRPGRGTAYMDRHRHARDDAVAYTDLPPELAADRREADALALQVALGLDADVFVTERPYLYRARGRSSRTKILPPGEAVAIVGLYLRSQGVYSVLRDHETHFPMRRGTYFAVGAVELMPSVWRWSAACRQTGDPRLADLAGSLVARMARALETRDELHRIVNRAKGGDTRAAVLSSVDTILLLLLTATAEVAARVTHRTLELSDRSQHRAGWHKPDWAREIQKRDKGFAPLIGEGTPGALLMTGVALLQNAIHAEALSALLFHDTPERTSILFALPPAHTAPLTAMFAAFGGEAAWGVREIHPGERYADPGVFTDQLFTYVLGFLDAVLARTPVERLPNVRLPLPDSPETAGLVLNRYSEASRGSIRWQLGL